MKKVAIIAEYNPFHNGHLYHLNKVKAMFPNCPIILILGGNFTQRGEVSILDKWTKTKIAIEEGIDLVVELPFPFATASADIFAEGAIELCNHLQVTDLVFGSETNDIEGIKKLVETQLYNENFDSLVKVYLKMGYNYPTALSKTLEELTNKLYNLPNDILGISYVKAIMKNKYNIIPHTIKRTNDYHNIFLDEEISSATSIRKALKNNKNITNQVPKSTIKYLSNDLPIIDNYFKLLKYKIISSNDLTIYNLVDKGLEEKLKKEIIFSDNYNELIEKVKSKNLTYSKLSRILLYILCDYKKEDKDKFNKIKYIRVLGFSNKGREYLNAIKKDLNIPLISKFTREKDDMLEFEYQTTKIYSLGYNNDIALDIIENEYKCKPIRKDD